MTPEKAAWGAVLGGLALGAAGFAFQPGAFPHAWLCGVVLAVAWPVGSLLLLLAHALTGGRWGDAIRPGLLAGVSTLFVLPLLVVPTLFTLPALYPWARPGGEGLPNHAWLNLPFFAGRGIVYLACWLGIGALVLRGGRLGPWAPFALAALAVTYTFASIDLTMSLQPRFTSSSYGMISLAGAGVLALALAVLLSPPAGRDADNDLGQLLLGLALLWAYLDFMQLLIVWQSDLVTQSPYYLVRAFGGPGIVAGVVALTHTVIPFFALLSGAVRALPPRAARGGRAAGGQRGAADLVAGAARGGPAVRSAGWRLHPGRGRDPGGGGAAAARDARPCVGAGGPRRERRWPRRRAWSPGAGSRTARTRRTSRSPGTRTGTSASAPWRWRPG